MSNLSNIKAQIKSFKRQINKAILVGIEKTSKGILRTAVSRFRPRPNKNAYPNVSGFLYVVSGTLRNSLLNASFGSNEGASVFRSTLRNEIEHEFGTSVNRKEFFYPSFHDHSSKFNVLLDLVKRVTSLVLLQRRKIYSTKLDLQKEVKKLDILDLFQIQNIKRN